ncbi:hypothetical protein GCM10010965_26800 [Caldalkalibacillus thermarum]|uniref:nickel pincer cofactor biosynthesis protein LarC n=1 Tax=Caldalkalibacillus thermarum TaxID=296745 RepID=UPI00166BD81F|nr:nickel pincer cofactor biosynthesis protein LarC [Caldalkalibacillus thermarum]GGK32523.1 hypothetical protein GCM10010965_26800 [Caldalkalibacillus thermarum]
MSTILYLDCSLSGISGDMTLGALADLGADLELIEQQLQSFPIEPFKLERKGVLKKGIYSQKVDVVVDPDTPPAHHRHYSTIKKMIEESQISGRAKQLAIRIFEPIAQAEAKIHNTSVDKVHFHEVGTVDSIVDIVGVAIALDQLEINQVFSSPVVVGSGSIHIDHGRYPVPAPATLEILRGVPILESDLNGELTTPTGAAIIKGLSTSFGPMPSMTVTQIGYGAGTKDFEGHPNVLRAVIGERVE